MKIILERWDRFVLLENETLEKYKDDFNSSSKLLDQVLKTTDKKQLEQFSTIASSDPEVLAAAKELLLFIQTIKKEKESSKVNKTTSVKEDLSADLGLSLYLGAQKIANSSLLQVLEKYGPGILTVAAAVLYAKGYIDEGTTKAMIETSRAIKERDNQEIAAGIFDLASTLA
jgi:hypothetical protein